MQGTTSTNEQAILGVNTTFDSMLAIEALILTPSFFILIRIGSDPMISITENKIKLTDKIAEMFIVNRFQ